MASSGEPTSDTPRAEVVLRGDRRLRPDVVVAATGFRRGLEPLVGHLGALDAAGLPRAGSGMPLAGSPGLWFIGYHTAIEGNLRRHPIEARRIARSIPRARSRLSATTHGRFGPVVAPALWRGGR